MQICILQNSNLSWGLDQCLPCAGCLISLTLWSRMLRQALSLGTQTRLFRCAAAWCTQLNVHKGLQRPKVDVLNMFNSHLKSWQSIEMHSVLFVVLPECVLCFFFFKFLVQNLWVSVKRVNGRPWRSSGWGAVPYALFPTCFWIFWHPYACHLFFHSTFFFLVVFTAYLLGETHEHLQNGNLL